VAKFVAFVSGSFAAMVLFLAIVNDVLMERHLAGHNLVYWGACLGVVLAVSRSLIGEGVPVFDPEDAMTKVRGCDGTPFSSSAYLLWHVQKIWKGAHGLSPYVFGIWTYGRWRSTPTSCRATGEDEHIRGRFRSSSNGCTHIR
jgi:hypothetical protein